MNKTQNLLNGIRVVSLEQYISGPYCTSILSDAGAEVIKVERPDHGDPRRTYQPRRRSEADYISGGFASYNRGKKSVAIDLSEDQGVVQLQRLLEHADVLVASLRPGSLQRLGLDADILREKYPRLVICEITGFGVTGGPFGDWPAFDSVIQAMSGLSSLLGEHAEDPPGLAPMSTMDLLAGVWAALGILTGLTSRAITGEGCHVDTSMYEVGAALLERPLVLHEFTGEVATRGSDAFSPVGSFQTADGRWIAVVIPTDDMWQRCCAAMERPDLLDHPEMNTVTKRARNMKSHVLPALESWAADHTLGQFEAAEKLRAQGQPAGPVQTIADVRQSAQLKQRQFFTPLQDARARNKEDEPLLLPRTPLIYNSVPAHPGPVPELGEHNSELLGIPGPNEV